MYTIIEIIISLIVASVPIITYLKRKSTDKHELLLIVLASIILLIGALIRIVSIELYPIGLNQDEASIGYESYSLLKYGIDRNGFSFPVHFVSWGSGQNALYGYLLIPFIMIFSNTVFSIRILMSIIGCLTLLVAYYLFKDVFNNKKGLVALFIFSIIPWHILKSRWGLESNIFPDLIFYSLVLIYFGIKNKKHCYFIMSSIILGISTYSYGTSYLFVPVFSIIMYTYLIIKKKITLKDGLIYLLISGLISLPMIIFVIINYFKLDSVKILNISIPRLTYNRFTEITSINGNFLVNSYNNFKNTINILLCENDGMILNYSPKYGVLYKISFPFILLGLFESVKNKKNIFLKFNNILFISSIILSFFVIPNINRVNILWLSLMIYIVIGVLFLFNHINKLLRIGVIGLYFVLFIFFVVNYFTKYQQEIGNRTFKGLEDAIKYTNNMKYDKLYITNKINQPYIYYLYFNRVNPNYYLNNRVFLNEEAMFQSIKNIDNVYFSIPSKLEGNNVYIIINTEIINYEITDYDVKRFDNFCVIY